MRLAAVTSRSALQPLHSSFSPNLRRLTEAKIVFGKEILVSGYLLNLPHVIIARSKALPQIFLKAW